MRSQFSTLAESISRSIESATDPEVNVSFAGSVADSIDLEMLSAKIDSCDLNKKRFPVQYYAFRTPKSRYWYFLRER